MGRPRLIYIPNHKESAMTTATTRKTRRLGNWTAEFVARWNEAAAAGLTRHEFAELTGIPYGLVTQRFNKLRQRGIELPTLKHGNAGNNHNSAGHNGWTKGTLRKRRKKSKLLAPLAGEVVAAPSAARQASIVVSSGPRFMIEERANCITITIGG
jgi:hypothetical protein